MPGPEVDWLCGKELPGHEHVSIPRLLALSPQVEEHDGRGVADRRVVAREAQAARRPVHAEDGQVVAALVAAVEEAARRVEVEAARVVPALPLLPGVLQRAVRADRKDRDAVVQAVAGVDELAARRDQDLRAEVAPREAGRQRRERGTGVPPVWLGGTGVPPVWTDRRDAGPTGTGPDPRHTMGPPGQLLAEAPPC